MDCPYPMGQVRRAGVNFSSLEHVCNRVFGSLIGKTLSR